VDRISLSRSYRMWDSGNEPTVVPDDRPFMVIRVPADKRQVSELGGSKRRIRSSFLRIFGPGGRRRLPLAFRFRRSDCGVLRRSLPRRFFFRDCLRHSVTVTLPFLARITRWFPRVLCPVAVRERRFSFDRGFTTHRSLVPWWETLSRNSAPLR